MQALVVNEDLAGSGNSFTVWPKDIFKIDFEVVSQVGQGQFGKVYSVKRKKGRDSGVTYAAKFINCKGATARLKVRDEMDLVRTKMNDNNTTILIGRHIPVHNSLGNVAIFGKW